MEMNKFTVVREVLSNIYRSRNLIGPYQFLGISPRNLTLFTKPFLTGRRVRAGHEISSIYTAPLQLWSRKEGGRFMEVCCKLGVVHSKGCISIDTGHDKTPS